MNLIHFLIDYIKGLNPASKSYYSRERRRKSQYFTMVDADGSSHKRRVYIAEMPKIPELETSASLVWEKQSNGAYELKLK